GSDSMSTLNTKTVCQLARLRPETLRYWIKGGFLTPARIGRRGQNNGHRYSARQATGIIVAAVLHQLQGVNPLYVMRVVRVFEEMPAPAFAGFFSSGGDDADDVDDLTDEEESAWIEKRNTIIGRVGGADCLSTEQAAVAEVVWERLREAGPAIRAAMKF